MFDISKYIKNNDDKEKFASDYSKFFSDSSNPKRAYDSYVIEFGVANDESFEESYESFELVYIGEFHTLEAFGLMAWDGAGFLNSIPEQLHRFINFRAYAEEEIFSGNIKRHGSYYYHTEW